MQLGSSSRASKGIRLQITLWKVQGRVFSPRLLTAAGADREKVGKGWQGHEELALDWGEWAAAPQEFWFMRAAERNSSCFQLSALPCSQELLP